MRCTSPRIRTENLADYITLRLSPPPGGRSCAGLYLHHSLPAVGAACQVSTPYGHVTVLARYCHFKGFTEFKQFSL